METIDEAAPLTTFSLEEVMSLETSLPEFTMEEAQAFLDSIPCEPFSPSATTTETVEFGISDLYDDDDSEYVDINKFLPVELELTPLSAST